MDFDALSDTLSQVRAGSFTTFSFAVKLVVYLFHVRFFLSKRFPITCISAKKVTIDSGNDQYHISQASSAKWKVKVSHASKP